MNIVKILSIGFTVCCLFLLPTYLGIKLGSPMIGIMIGGIGAVSYVLYAALHTK